MEAAFERAKQGAGQFFLVEEHDQARAVELARAHGFAVVWASCQADTPAYWRNVVGALASTPALVLVDDTDEQLTRFVVRSLPVLPLVLVVTTKADLVTRAHTALEQGRITEARDLLDQAARDGHPEAALGLQGMWVNKFRGRADRALAISRLRDALATDPSEPLRTRLVTRLAAEHAYHRRESEPVLEALEHARTTGDPLTIAEALSLAHHALWSPQHVVARLGLTAELIEVASAAGLDLLALSGLCRRTQDLFCLGDPHAERSQVELAERAAGHPGLMFFHAAMDVMRTIRAGRFAAAEQKAGLCLKLGLDLGDVDAETFHSTHFFAIRWMQGHGRELVDLAETVTQSPTLPDLEFTFEAAHALLAMEAGQPDRARAALQRMTINGLAAVPLTSNWLTCMFSVVHVAAGLEESEIAREAYHLLEPFADLPVVPATAVVCFGSTELLLGMAARTFGDHDLAAAHLERAVTTNIRLGNRPMTAYARAQLAQVVAGDRARDLLDLAVADAAEMGMTDRVAQWTRPDRISFRREGSLWVVSRRSTEVRVEDLVGMRYLARLVAAPGTDIAALELVGGEDSGNQPVLDSSARTAYLARVRDLRARADEDPRAQAELEALLDHLERETGLGGRTRNFAGPAERARTAVRKAIRRAIDAIAVTEPSTADALRSSVTTGYRCSYRP
ncbi:hypothetical protein [Lentzea sp. NPDC051838]|uniref:hypothetical protein n=1 Tax=Lentzea sp. NPDC051838 TaxID=3154849 RepID=UPI003421DC28